LQGLYQLLQDRPGHEEWIAFWIYAIVRDAALIDRFFCIEHDPRTKVCSVGVSPATSVFSKNDTLTPHRGRHFWQSAR